MGYSGPSAGSSKFVRGRARSRAVCQPDRPPERWTDLREPCILDLVGVGSTRRLPPTQRLRPRAPGFCGAQHRRLRTGGKPQKRSSRSAPPVHRRRHPYQARRHCSVSRPRRLPGLPRYAAQGPGTDSACRAVSPAGGWRSSAANTGNLYDPFLTDLGLEPSLGFKRLRDLVGGVRDLIEPEQEEIRRGQGLPHRRWRHRALAASLRIEHWT